MHVHMHHTKVFVVLVFQYSDCYKLHLTLSSIWTNTEIVDMVMTKMRLMMNLLVNYLS